MADVSGTSRSTASVDERIVEAKFDASDFEKGVNKTIKKLDELKSSLNLDDAGKSLTQVADETKKATEKASESVDQLEKRLTTFAGMLKQKFLGGLADQVVGVFFKMEHAVTGFVKEMTVGMADAGRAGYEQMLTSVRMITSAFKRDSTGKIIGRYEADEAYSALEQLKTYADETSYSMDQMTDAMSKMVAAGVPLEDAAKNVQGIANACANAGINAQDASRAFFNLSQAYSSGVLKYTDFRSLELLNMTNESFKQAMLDAGVEAGTLKKTKDGVYKTVRKKGTKVTGGKTVNMQNLTDSLKYSWMTTEGMDKLFGKQFYADIDEITTMLYDKNMDMEEVLDVISKKYGETAANAFKAAREARSFTDVVNTLRGIASAGWSNIWENMFGKLEEATKFFTKLADGGIADAIRSLFSYVNELLGAWADGGAESGGRDAFKETLLTIDELIGEINEKLMSLLPNSEDAGYAFKRFTQDTRDNVNKFKSWLTDAGEDGESRLDKLVNVARIFSQTFGVAFYALGKAFSLAEPVLSGAFVILDKLIEPLSQLGKNSKPFDDLTDSVDNLYKVLSPITKALGDVMGIVGDVAAFFFSGAIDTAIMNISFFSDAFGLLLEIITGKSAQKQRDGKGVIGHITDDIENLKNVCMAAIGAVKDFFASLFEDLRKILGLSTEVENGEAGEGFFTSVKNFFDTNQFLKDADAWIQQAKTDIDAWIAKLPEKITNFATRIQEAIFGLFYTKETQTKTVTDDVHTVTRTFEVIKETDLKKNLDAWWESIKSTVTDFITNLPSKVHELASKLFDAVYGLFYTKESRTVSVTDDTHTMTKKFEFVKETDLKKGLDAWWEGVKKSVTEFIDSIPKRVQDFFNSIPDLWNTLMISLFGGGSEQAEATSDAAATTDTTQAAEKTETELDKWLSTVKDTIIEFIKSIPTRLATLGTKIYETIFGIFYERKEVNVANTGKTTTLIATPFKKWIDGIRKSINQWLNKLPKITLQDLWNRIFVVEKKDDKGNVVQEKTGFALMLEGIFGEEQIQNFKASIDNFIGKISGFVENAKKTFNSIWTRISGELSAENFSDTIKGIFDDILNLIASLFTGTTDIEVNGEWFANTVASAIIWIKTKAEEAWPTVRDFIKSIPSKIAGLFKSGDSGDQEQSAVGKAISDFGATVGGFIADLPGMITGFFDSAVTEIDALWGRIYKALSGEGETQETPGIGEDPSETVGDADQTVSKWDTFITNLGSSISAAIAKLPEWLAQGLELAVKGINWVLGKITELLTPAAIADSIESGTDVGQAVADAVAADTDPEKTAEASGLATTLGKLGQALLDLITKTIPGFIVAGFTAVKDKASEWLAPIGESFTNLANQIPENETLMGKVKFVGSKIVDKIKEIIPESIKEGFRSVRDNVNGWWSSLDGIFDSWLDTNNNESSPLKRKIAQIGKVIKKAIEDLGQMIANLFGGQSAQSTDKKGQTPINPLIDSYRQMFEQVDKLPSTEDLVRKYEEHLAAPKEGIKIDIQKSEPTLFDQITSFIDKLMTSVGEYAKNAFGLILPFIIDGWNGLITSIGKIIGSIGDLISRKKQFSDVVTEIFGEEASASIMESLNNFGSTISDFFTKTIPEAFNNIKAAIEEKGGIGGLFTSIFDGLFGSKAEAEAEEKSDDIEENVEKTGDWLTDMMDFIKTKSIVTTAVTGGGIIVALLAIVKIIETIKEVINAINITGNIAARAEAKNSMETVFKRITETLMVAMAFTVYASRLNDEQFAKAESVFTKVINFLTLMTELYTAMKGVTAVTDTFQAYAPSELVGDAAEAAKGAGGIGSMLLGGFKAIVGGVAASAVAEIGSYSIQDVINSIVSTLENIVEGLNVMANIVNEAMDIFVEIDSKSEAAGKAVDATITLINKFIELNTDETREGMSYATTAITELSGAIALLKQAYTGTDLHVEEITEGLNSIIDMQDKMKIFAEFSETTDYSNFKYAIASLGAAVSLFDGKTISDIGNADEAGISNAVSVLNQIFGNDELRRLAAQLTPDNVPNQDFTLEAAERLSILATSLLMMGKAADGMNAQVGKNINGLFQAINEIDLSQNAANGYWTGTNADSTEKSIDKVTNISFKLGELGNALGSFADNVRDLDDTKLTNANRAIDMFTRLGTTLNDIARGPLEKWLFGDGDMNTFSNNIGILGTQLRDFFKSVDYNDAGEATTHNIQNVQAVGELLVYIGQALHLIGGNSPQRLLKGISDNIIDFGTNFTAFLVNLQGSTFDASDMDKIDAAVQVAGRIAKIAKELKDVDNMTKITKFSSELLTSFLGNIESLSFSLYKYLENNEVDTDKLTRMFHALGSVISSIYDITVSYTEHVRATDIQTSQDVITRAITLLVTLSDKQSLIESSLEKFKKPLDYSALTNIKNIVGTLQAIGDLVTSIHTDSYFHSMAYYIEEAINNFALLDFSGIDLLGKNAEKHMHNLELARTVFETIKELGAAVYYFSFDRNVGGVKNSVASQWERGLAAIENLDWDVITGINEKIAGSITAEDQQDEYITAGKKIAYFISQGIQAAFDDPENNDVGIEITPVLNMSKIQAQMTEDLGINELNFSGLTFSIPQELYDAIKIPDYSEKLDQLHEDVGSLSSDIMTLKTAIEGMNLYLDGRKLVGGIMPSVIQEINNNDFYNDKGLTNQFVEVLEV